MKRLLSILCSFLLILVGAEVSTAGVALAQFPAHTTQAQQSVEPYLLDLTLLPNFSRSTVTLIGQFHDRPCSNVELDWFSEAIQLQDEADSIDENICAFEIRSFGRAEIEEDSAGEPSYVISLPRLYLPNEDDSLQFIVPDADVLYRRMTPRPVRTGDTLLWELRGSFDGLDVPIRPWKFETTLTVTPLLNQQLETHTGARVFLRGETTISGISDSVSYNAFIEDGDLLTRPSLSELLTLNLDYPALHFSDSYPGLGYVPPYYLMDHARSLIWLETDITSHHAPEGAQTGNLNIQLAGSQSPIAGMVDSESGCPTHIYTRTAVSEQFGPEIRKTVLCVRLGPDDTLTLQIPNVEILLVTREANAQIGSSTFVYEGPLQAEITVYYQTTSETWVQQLPLLLRMFPADLEAALESSGKGSVLSLILGFAVYVAILVGRRAASNRWPQGSLGILADGILWLIAGIFLLYWTPSIVSLTLLAVLVLTPYLNLKPERANLELWVIVVFVVVVLADTFLTVSSPNILYKQQHLGSYTPWVIIILLGIIYIGYIRWNQTATVRKEMLHMSRKPPLIMLLMIVGTYEAINQSLFSLVLIVLLVALMRWRMDRINQMRQRTPAGAALPSQPTSRTNLPDWLGPFGEILGARRMAVILFLGSIVALNFSPNASLNNLHFTVLTLVGVALLFTVVYDAVPGKEGFVKALFLPIPLLFIFFTGIATTSVLITTPNISWLGNSSSALYAVFISQTYDLLIGRMIFYLTVPLLIGLLVEYQKGTLTGTPSEWWKKITVWVSIFMTILSVLIPILRQFTTNESLINFREQIEQILPLITDE